MAVRSFQELHVWQHAMDFVIEVHALTAQFPKDEMYGLTSQLRRAVYSIPSNIAEGQARGATKEFRHFLFVARGSLAEVQTQIWVAERLIYITNEQANVLIEHSNSIGRQLNALIRALNNKLSAE